MRDANLLKSYKVYWPPRVRKSSKTNLDSHHKRASKKPAHSKSHPHEPPPSKLPKDLLAYSYKQLKQGKPVAAGHAGHGEEPFTSVREIHHNGHKITIETQYNIRVDGVPVSGHIYVDNMGKVSSHAFPAYSFPSAVDLVRKMIDEFPDEFTKKGSSQHDTGIVRKGRSTGR